MINWVKNASGDWSRQPEQGVSLDLSWLNNNKTIWQIVITTPLVRITFKQHFSQIIAAKRTATKYYKDHVAGMGDREG